MLNNKGQSLVLFIIILPILLFVLVLVIDVGKVMVLKQELDNINQIVLDYGLDKLSDSSNKEQISNSDDTDLNVEIENNINNDYDNNIVDIDIINDEMDISYIESKLIDLVKLNKVDIDMINVRIDDSKIYIDLYDKMDGMFSKLVDISIFNVKSSYVGYIDNNDKKMERVRGD